MVKSIEIPEGYQKTEVGIIPLDWEVKKIDNEIDLLTGYPFPSSKYVESGIRLLRGSNVKRGVTDWSEDITQYWEKLTPELKPYILIEGDIVVAMDGSLVGKSFARLTNKDLPALLLQRVARIRSNKIDLGYLKEFICSEYFTKYCESVKTVSAIPHISPKEIRNFIIPLPPTKSEQTAIATALSDIDALIENFEKLISKKRNIKQGAMQELLTGRKRLAGFEDEWGKNKIGNILKVRHGRSQKDVKGDNGIYPILGTGGLMGYANEYLYDSESVLIGRKGTIDKPQFMNSPFWTVDTLFYTEIREGYSPKFIYYKFLLIDWYSYNEASGVPSLNAKTIENIEIVIPSYETQLHIAKILTDMDAEIKALEQKLHKYRMIKQGMMQVLLTGKIRLI